MFSRKHTAERTAAQAWEYLSAAMASAGDSAREAGLHAVDVTSAKAAEFGKQGTKLAGKAGLKSPTLTEKASRKGAELTGKAGRRVNAVAEEAWSRANAAANALAGNRPGLPWGLIIGAGLIGVALGWAAATTARAALERQAENEELELTETAVVVTPAPTAYDS
jgi:hypothetical protein